MKFTQHLLFLYLLICLSVIGCQAGGSHRIGTTRQAQTQPLFGYTARTTPIKAHEGQTRLQIYSRKTGRVAWSGIVGSVGEAKDFTWSADHTATAMIDRTNGDYRLLIWQVGKGIRVISRLPVPAREAQHSDYMEGDALSCDIVGQAIISPDKRRVLILCSQSQGPASIGLYQLWCLTLRTRHLRFIYQYAYEQAGWENSHRSTRWVNSHRITYKQQRSSEAKGGEWEFIPVTQTL